MAGELYRATQSCFFISDESFMAFKIRYYHFLLKLRTFDRPPKHPGKLAALLCKAAFSILSCQDYLLFYQPTRENYPHHIPNSSSATINSPSACLTPYAPWTRPNAISW